MLESYLDGDSIDGLKQKTDEVLENKVIDLRSGEAAILKFLQAKEAMLLKQLK